jgi:predicted Zn-dependent protease
MTLAQEGGFEPAVERLFLTLLEKQPGDAELRYRLATYYRRAGMAARAILQLRLVLSADSGHAGAWRDLGELEAGEGRRGR